MKIPDSINVSANGSATVCYVEWPSLLDLFRLRFRRRKVTKQFRRHLRNHRYSWINVETGEYADDGLMVRIENLYKLIEK